MEDSGMLTKLGIRINFIFRQGTKENLTEALKMYEKGAEKGDVDSMASFALIVIENLLSQKYKQAYGYLKKCFDKKNNARCRYATSVFILFDSLKKVRKKVKKLIKKIFS